MDNGSPTNGLTRWPLCPRQSGTKESPSFCTCLANTKEHLEEANQARERSAQQVEELGQKLSQATEAMFEAKQQRKRDAQMLKALEAKNQTADELAAEKDKIIEQLRRALLVCGAYRQRAQTKDEQVLENAYLRRCVEVYQERILSDRDKIAGLEKAMEVQRNQWALRVEDLLGQLREERESAADKKEEFQQLLLEAAMDKMLAEEDAKEELEKLQQQLSKATEDLQRERERSAQEVELQMHLAEAFADAKQEGERSAKEVEELQQQLSKAAADAKEELEKLQQQLSKATEDLQQERERSTQEVELQMHLAEAFADAKQEGEKRAKEVEELQQQLSKAAAETERSANEIEELQQQLSQAVAGAVKQEAAKWRAKEIRRNTRLRRAPSLPPREVEITKEELYLRAKVEVMRQEMAEFPSPAELALLPINEQEFLLARERECQALDKEDILRSPEYDSMVSRGIAGFAVGKRNNFV